MIPESKNSVIKDSFSDYLYRAFKLDYTYTKQQLSI